MPHIERSKLAVPLHQKKKAPFGALFGVVGHFRSQLYGSITKGRGRVWGNEALPGLRPGKPNEFAKGKLGKYHT